MTKAQLLIIALPGIFSGPKVLPPTLRCGGSVLGIPADLIRLIRMVLSLSPAFSCAWLTRPSDIGKFAPQWRMWQSLGNQGPGLPCCADFELFVERPGNKCRLPQLL